MLIWLKRIVWGLSASLIGILSVADLPGEDEADEDWHRQAPVRCARSGPAAPAHEFFGRHLLASYTDCDPRALRDLGSLRVTVDRAVRASGATRLSSVEHVFPPHGLTMVVLLSESHASIHTYPEHNACFVDLFTCGRSCSAEQFDRVLRGYLRPGGVDCQVVVREQASHTDGLRA